MAPSAPLRDRGPCPLCGRRMLDDGVSVGAHHLVPKRRGGRQTTWLHRICHRKLHRRWTEKELAERYNTVEAILADGEFAHFADWVRRKHPQYDARTAASRDKGVRRA